MAKITKLKMKIDTEPMKAIEQQLNDLAKFLEKKNEIYDRVCLKVTPLARQLMLSSLERSGLKIHSGHLKRFVAESIVVATKKGISIRGPKGRDVREYVKTASIQYGRLSGVQSGLGRKTRAKLKKAVSAGFGPTGSKASSAHPYYLLNEGQVQQLAAAFNKELQGEYDRFAAYSARVR